MQLTIQIGVFPYLKLLWMVSSITGIILLYYGWGNAFLRTTEYYTSFYVAVVFIITDKRKKNWYKQKYYLAVECVNSNASANTRGEWMCCFRIFEVNNTTRLMKRKNIEQYHFTLFEQSLEYSKNEFNNK